MKMGGYSVNSHARTGKGSGTAIVYDYDQSTSSGLIGLDPNALEELNAGEAFKKIEKMPKRPVDINALKKKYSGFHQGRRIAPRYGVSLHVILYTVTKSFRTSSVNISASGVLLKDYVPEEFLKESFDVVFVDQADSDRRYMVFRAKAVGGPVKTDRITFLSSISNSQEVLMNVLDDLTPLAEGY
jgi:hypothetical protein